ncbi:unnamed protein product [Callosobruchus maculatus]|uniref:Uncharacterized protein n=1 Tax=Callosobruchus maculatus TaxID=64391 RepID=A0A653BK79_CALMS|nr:unnamed protein product [Callosobruchus maculatus]
MQAVYQAVINDGVALRGKLTSFKKLFTNWVFTDIRAKRTEYLRKLKSYKEQGRNIVYSDETYIHSSHTVPKSWDDGTDNCLKSPVVKGKRLIILHCDLK